MKLVVIALVLAACGGAQSTVGSSTTRPSCIQFLRHTLDIHADGGVAPDSAAQELLQRDPEKFIADKCADADYQAKFAAVEDGTVSCLMNANDRAAADRCSSSGAGGTTAVTCSGPEPTATTGTGKLRGAVHGKSNALAGATIIVTPLTKTEITDNSGNFLIEDLPEGTYTIAIYYADATQTQCVKVSDGSTTSMDIKLPDQ